MTRFAREFNGELGEFWYKDAHKQVEKMKAQWDNGDIICEEDGAVKWKSNGHYLPEDCAEILAYTFVNFSRKATEIKRDAQTKEFLDSYRKTHANRVLSDEERYEMICTFGKGATVVDAITGQRFHL